MITTKYQNFDHAVIVNNDYNKKLRDLSRWNLQTLVFLKSP